jgi:hypothetical protein
MFEKPHLSLMNSAKTAAVLIIGLGMATPALADNYLSCNAIVSDVSISPQGSVYVTFSGMGTPLMCNLNSSTTAYQTGTNGGAATITVATCQALLSTFLTAKASAQSMTLSFDFGSATPPACTSIASLSSPYAFSWTTPAPYPYTIQFGQ